MGTAHPTGFPTYVLVGWLASVVLQPFGEPAFRMNLLSTICVAVAAGVTVDLVRRLTGWLALGMAAGIGLALMPIAWAIATHAETHTLHLAFVAILLWLLVAWEERRPAAAPRPCERATAVTATWSRRPRSSGWLVGNHSLTLLLAIPVGLYVLAVDPGIWRRGRLVAACVGGAGPDRRPRLPRAPVTCRAVPRPARVRHARHLGGVQIHRPGRAVPGQPARSVRGPAAQVRRPRDADRHPVRDPRPAHPDRLRRDRPAPAALRAVDRDGRRDHLLLRRVVRQRRHQPLLPRAGADGLDVAGHPGRGRRRAAGGLAGDPGDAAYAATTTDEPNVPTSYIADEAHGIDESGPAATGPRSR